MKNEFSIFYSWQSGPYDKENRYLISGCLNDVVKELRKTDISVRIEQDTRGSAGSADIPQTLFQKIETADVFVGDISIINPGSAGERKTPNPNVLIELGYAASVLKWERIIPVFNLKFGALEDAPFDIRHRRIIAFDTTKNIATAKKHLTSRLLHAIQSILSLSQDSIVPAKSALAHLLLSSIHYAWSTVAESDEDEPSFRNYLAPGAIDSAPVVLESHFQLASSLQFELAENEFALLADILDISQKMRSGTEDAYGWEYAHRLAERCFESVWIEYADELTPISMEKCLRPEIVQLMNHFLPEEKQISYSALRTTADGKAIFFADEKHIEAHSKDGALLIKVDLDDCGRITGWKKEPAYQGEFAHSVRHGNGTEFSRKFHHIGETRCVGRWENGHFVEGTLCQAILSKDETAEDGYAFEAGEDGFPLLLCDVDLDFLLRSCMPDDCEQLYAVDLYLHKGSFELAGTPNPLCPRKNGTHQFACLDCPKENPCEQEN